MEMEDKFSKSGVYKAQAKNVYHVIKYITCYYMIYWLTYLCKSYWMEYEIRFKEYYLFPQS
jgi:hypothetical protein